MQTAKQKWDSMSLIETNRFLKNHGFNLGWSAHTWKYLDRQIQAKFECAS